MHGVEDVLPLDADGEGLLLAGLGQDIGHLADGGAALGGVHQHDHGEILLHQHPGHQPDRAAGDVTEINILQGRNSVDDVDYFDHAVLEASADGKTWTPLIGELDRQYEINWTGEPVKARYVRLRRLDSKRTNYASVRVFSVNPVRPGNLGFDIEAVDASEAARAFDRNPATSYMMDGRLRFGVGDNAG